MTSTTGSSDVSKIKPSHIVGIGASAGGLSALEQFFDNMPPDTGMAFVVIQHLSPDFKSLMDDLLSRHTSMPIHRVTSGIELQPDSIYLIPPKTHMTIREEKLYLTEKTISPHTELPIDIFFNSLAEDAGDRAIGVVLSGTGSDGSRGIASINKNGGLVLVQSPESAQFDGMPRNAIATGLCDFILPPNRIPRILIEYAISPLAVRTRMHHELEVFEDEGEYAGIFALLRRGYNLDFSKYKGSTVGRRIRRRMEFRQISEVADYATIVSGDQGELELLYKDLLIGVTEFFRDKQAFDFLEEEIIPRLFANLHRGDDLRVWSAACATGEEAYSIAILLAEKAEEIGFMGKITVFATDVHKTSLDFASQGLYDRARLTNVSPERMDRFFKKEGGDLFRVTSELRKLVVFAPHNLLNDPPFTRLDLVCCRNLLIYFQSDVQEKVISLFHFALKIDSILFLGSSEGLGAFAGEFEVIANQHKLFRKIRDLKLAINLDANRIDRKPNIPVTMFQPGSSRTIGIDRQVLSDYDTLLRRHIPPGVLIDENRNIIHYFGNVAEYLKMPEGRAEQNILALVEDNLHIALTTSLQRADSTRQFIVTRNVRIKRGTTEFLIDLNVSPLPDEKSHTTHYHVYFERVRQTDQPAPPEISEDADSTNFDVENHFRQHVADLEMELQSTRENLQSTVEELQTSNEELQATNEELLASNEELQSTNEELHSVNEELYSVNSEFERKNLELKQLNNDHENLLASTDIGTVFLDRQLRIRKYNPAIASFFKLLPQDIGRPIDHIAYHLSQQEEMLADINRVLGNGIPVEQEEETRDERWLLRRIMPFRTETGQVEGVVITFTDITTIKAAELKVLSLNEELEHKVEERTQELQLEVQERRRAELTLRKLSRAVEQSPATIVITDTQGTIEFVNPKFTELTGYTPEEAIGQNPRLLKSGKTPPETHTELWETISAGKTWEGDFLNKSKDGTLFWEHATISALRDDSGVVTHYLAVKEDVTEKKNIVQQLIAAKEHAEDANRAKSEFLANMSHEIRTPMDGIMGMSQLLGFSELNEEQREYLSAIRSSSGNLLSLINNILDLSKIEAGRIELEARDFSLRSSIDDVTKTQIASFRMKGIELHTKISADIPDLLNGDQLRLKQILMNILGNAVKFTNKGSVTISATLDRQMDDILFVKLSILDTGIGIAPDALENVFNPFCQEDSSTTRRYGGTGLGLSISKKLAGVMGGEIWAESEKGTGSTFTVVLPLREALDAESTLDTDTAAADFKIDQEALWKGKPIHFLVVDDQEINLTVTTKLLEKIGQTFETAEGGSEALEKWKNGRFDIILMDIEMPEMDGVAAARFIRNAEKDTDRETPIIALTAHALKNDRQYFLDLGFHGYASKPIDMDCLLGEIRHCLKMPPETASL